MTEQCQESIPNKEMSEFHQCKRKAKIGKWCKQHAKLHEDDEI